MRRAPSCTSASRSSLSASCSSCSETTMLNMRRTSLWTASQPSLVVNNQERTPRSSSRPRSTTSGYISCPFCGMAYPDIKRIQSRLGDQLRFVYRHFPRPEHPHARNAAEAAEAAAAQGPQYFWAMHDQLFEHQRALDDSSLLAHASHIGLDIDRFRADFTRHAYHER